MSRVCIGCDPGSKGGLCAIQDGKILEIFPIPTISIKLTSKRADGEYKIKNIVDGKKVTKLFKKYPNAVVVIEDVKTISKGSKSSNFTLGQNLGALQGIALGVFGKYYTAYSKTWAKAVLKKEDIAYLDSTETNINTKKTTLNAAKRIFPDQDFHDPKVERRKNSVWHDGMYEAALMAVYGEKMIEEGHIKGE